VDAKKIKAQKKTYHHHPKKQNSVSEYLFQISGKGIPESKAIHGLLANEWSQEQLNEAQVSNEASSPISLSTDP
jgi:hypothetical protein